MLTRYSRAHACCPSSVQQDGISLASLGRPLALAPPRRGTPAVLIAGAGVAVGRALALGARRCMPCRTKAGCIVLAS